MSDELNMSSVTADPAPETAGKRAAPEEKPPKTPGKRAGLIIGIAAAVLVLAYAGCCVAANALYSHTAFPNTSVLGMDVSGLSAQEAEQRWTEQGSALLDGMTIRLTRDGQEIGSTTLSDLGVTVLPVYVSKAAGCDVQDRGWGSDVTAFLRGGWRYIESWYKTVDVTPQLDVDEAKLTAACEQLSDTVGCTVVDGGYRLEKGEGLYITKPADGRMLDAPQLESDLAAMLQSGELTPVAGDVGGDVDAGAVQRTQHDGTACHQRGSDAARKVSTAPGVLKAVVFGVGRIIGVAGAGTRQNVLVIAGVLVFVLDHHTQRRTGGASVQQPRQHAGLVAFAARGGGFVPPGGASRHLHQHRVHIHRVSGGQTVQHTADGCGYGG